MTEETKSVPLLSYISTIFVADLLLLAIAFVFGGSSISRMAAPLGYLGAATFLLGLVLGSGYAPGDLPRLFVGGGRPALRAMGGGRSLHSPLADYATSLEEEQMEPHLEDGSRKENEEYGMDEMDEQEEVRLRARRNAKLSICLTVASLLALGESLLLGRLFPG